MRWLLMLMLAGMIVSCHERVENPNETISLDYYSSLRTDELAISSQRILSYIDSMVSNDHDEALADFKARSYYLNRNALLWIDRLGVHSNADTLVKCISGVAGLGFTDASFRLNRIRKDLERARTLSFDDVNTVSRVFARLEYNLTKAYLRYTIGQRFGYVNPYFLLNKLDVKDSSSTSVTYRKLFDVRIDRPGKDFYSNIFRMAESDSLASFLRSIQPKSHLYTALLSELHLPDLTPQHRRLVLTNLEKARWRMSDTPERHSKYVIVNIPAQKLYMYDDGNVKTMLIGCGSRETKTPLLNSYIKRMDVNPQWVIPFSIIKKDIVRHAGNEGYFDRRRFFICERKSGKMVSPADVTSKMLLDGNYRVIQMGGEGNSLGRIIFRFDNNFAVFLHDTSSRGVFNQRQRDVSHGCVRVEKPTELAEFLLGKGKEKIMERIVYSMSVNTTEDNEGHYNGERVEKIDQKKIINSVNVKPEIPLFISYFTLFNVDGTGFKAFPDIYGYDKVIFDALKTYMK